MEAHFLDFAKGYIQIRISGEACSRFFNLCAYHRIRLWNLTLSGKSYEACLLKKDFFALRPILRKSHVRLRIVRRCGLPFLLSFFRRRKLFLPGIFASLFLLFWLSSHIWNIRIDGNITLTDDVLFEYLSREGVFHGMKKSNIDCKNLADSLREEFPSLSWTSVELTGTRLNIHVHEGRFSKNAPLLSTENDGTVSPESVSGLAASKSGTVISIYVRSGLPLVSAGESVKEGQLLVTGILPVYNDNGEISHYRYTAADADIRIRYELTYSDQQARILQKKVYTGRIWKRTSMEILEHPFSLFSAFPSGICCDITAEIHQLHLLENFYLPIFLKTYTVKEYEYQQISLTNEQLLSLLQVNLQLFMKNLEEKGVQIFENNVKIEWTEKSAVASGTLTAEETAVRRIAESDVKEELPQDEYD